MQKRRFLLSGFVVVALAGFLTACFAFQGAHASELGSSMELMPYDVLCGPVPPVFDGDPSEETRVPIGVVDPVLDDVRTLITELEFQKALGQLDAAGLVAGASPRSDYYRVLSLCGIRGRLSDAVAVVQLMAPDEAYRGLAHYALACTYLNQSGLYDSSNPGAALLHLEEARSELPFARGIKFYTGLAFLELGDFESAVEMLSESVAESKSFAEAHVNLGFALAKLGRTQEALESMLAATRLHYDTVQVHMAIGDLYIELGGYEAAAASFRRATGSQGGSLSARYKLSLALLLAGEAGEARDVATDLVSQYPRHFDGHVVLGRARLALGDVQGAIEAFNQALWLRPGHYATRLDLANAYLAASEYDMAKSCLDEALAIYGGDAAAYMLLARVLEARGDVDGAREAALKSVRIAPTDPTARELYERLK
jgi:tetratricopeptide (TPR) repeat protein